MILIVGLGNPGRKYQMTRHNIGFEMVNSFHKYFSFPDYKSKFDGLYSKKKLFGRDIIIFKPQIFMNLSGNPIRKIRSFYKINDLKDLILIHDDMDMEFLKIRIKKSGGHGGHNGVRDTIKFNGEDFYRIKFGIKNEELKKGKVKPENFVLDKFSENEKLEIAKLKKLSNKNFEYIVNKEFPLFKQNILVS